MATIEDVPFELLFTIAQELDIHEIVTTWRLVCWRFYAVAKARALRKQTLTVPIESSLIGYFPNITRLEVYQMKDHSPCILCQAVDLSWMHIQFPNLREIIWEPNLLNRSRHAHKCCMIPFIRLHIEQLTMIQLGTELCMTYNFHGSSNFLLQIFSTVSAPQLQTLKLFLADLDVNRYTTLRIDPRRMRTLQHVELHARLTLDLILEMQEDQPSYHSAALLRNLIQLQLSTCVIHIPNAYIFADSYQLRTPQRRQQFHEYLSGLPAPFRRAWKPIFHCHDSQRAICEQLRAVFQEYDIECTLEQEMDTILF